MAVYGHLPGQWKAALSRAAVSLTPTGSLDASPRQRHGKSALDANVREVR